VHDARLEFLRVPTGSPQTRRMAQIGVGAHSQTFVEWAAQTINKSFWAGTFYQQQRAKGSPHQVAVRALAFKWIRILYRCWMTHTPYDESRYLKALQLRGSPLLAGLATKTA
jgi:hypothetical protein